MVNGGFFTYDQIKDLEKSGKNLRLTPNCASCGLYRKCKTPKMKVSGKGKKEVLIVGEAPGEDEDRVGRQFVGKTGKRLRSNLEEIGVKPNRDCWFINAANCRPTIEGANRPPTDLEIAHCRPIVWNAIKELQPKVIILLGECAVKSVIGHIWKESGYSIGLWRGFDIPDRTTKAWICPTYHPSFVARNDKDWEDNLAEVFWKRDLLQAFAIADKPGEIRDIDEEKRVKIVTDTDEIVDLLKLQYKLKKLMAYDYECNCIKPHNEGSDLYTCGISTHPFKALAFPTDEYIVKVWLAKILCDPDIPKICHNMQFEWMWTESILGKAPQNIVWDTMMGSHFLDNRTDTNSLKFQTYVQFGIPYYAEMIDKFLSTTKGSSSYELNKIHLAPKKPLLIYNGMDAMYTLRLALVQWLRMRDYRLEMYKDKINWSELRNAIS